MQKIISAISLLFAVSLLFCSCGSAGDNTCETKDPSINRTVYGSADREYAHEFIYEITGTDGEIQSFVIKTDEQTVCDALTKLGVITAEKAEKGTAVSVANIQLPEGYVWKFYINGNICKDDFSSVEITDGTVYSLVARKK